MPQKTSPRPQWQADHFYKIGKLGKPHGVKGEITFHFDDDIFDRTEADFLALEVQGLLVPFFFEEYRFKGSETALVKFVNVDTQERARELTGCNVFFPRQEGHDAEAPLSWAAIVGFTVKDAATDKPLGTILAVDDSTANTLFEVDVNGSAPLLLPASYDLIAGVDAQQREITMHLPDGILDLD